MSFSFLYVTIDSKNNADKIANKLITDNLAICVNIIHNTTSIYKWKGKVENSQELIMFIKTKKKLIEKTMEMISKLHPYEVPCIVEISIESLNNTYLEWIANS